jgi:hypothetical protein
MKKVSSDDGGCCFGAGTPILMEDGRWCPISELSVGNAVSGGYVILAITVMPTYSGELWCHFTCVFTPHHPVANQETNATYVFAKDLPSNSIRTYTCPTCVYNLVLDRGHQLVTPYTNTVTLGHGFMSSKVLTHPFFGTTAVIKDLITRPEFGKRGQRIELSGVKRDVHTGLVCAFEYV